jgi:hypothetical protein
MVTFLKKPVIFREDSERFYRMVLKRGRGKARFFEKNLVAAETMLRSSSQ